MTLPLTVLRYAAGCIVNTKGRLEEKQKSRSKKVLSLTMSGTMTRKVLGPTTSCTMKSPDSTVATNAKSVDYCTNRLQDFTAGHEYASCRDRF